MINKETNGSWYFQPEKPKAKHIKAEVLGGYAFRVKATKGANPWDVQASSPIAGAINEGDVIMLNYYARAEEPAEGGSSLTVRIQLAGRALHLGARHDDEDLRGMEELLRVPRGQRHHREKTRAACPSTWPPPSRSSTWGRCMVFNFGKGYDTKKLAFCDG